MRNPKEMAEHPLRQPKLVSTAERERDGEGGGGVSDHLRLSIKLNVLSGINF